MSFPLKPFTLDQRTARFVSFFARDTLISYKNAMMKYSKLNEITTMLIEARMVPRTGLLPLLKNGESNIIPDRQTNTPQANKTVSTVFLFEAKYVSCAQEEDRLIELKKIIN